MIYVSCPPFPQILTSVFFKKRLGKPLVLDFRDAWSLDPYQEGSRFKKFVYKFIFPKIEKWAFSYSDGVILNTPSTLKAYQSHYPEYASKMFLITNGYDEKAFLGLSHLHEQKKGGMSILYCGRFGVGGRKVESLLDGLALTRNELNIKLSIYGNQPENIAGLIREKGLDDCVDCNEQIPHFEALQKMYQHDVLLMYQEESSSEVQPIAGKTFEYIRVGKPVLSIAPPGDNQALIRRYVKIHEIVEDATPENIAKGLQSLYLKWSRGKLNHLNIPDESFSKNYERRELTRKLCALFDSYILKDK